MRIRSVIGFALAVCLLAPGSVLADSPTETFDLLMPTPNMAEAPNGDQVALLGGGTFSVHPKSVTASGTFEHTDTAGNVLGGGTWTATELLSYHSYGCGVLSFTDPPTPLPPNFCGGAVKMRVVLTAGASQFDGILTVFCIIGPNPPNSHDDLSEEGVTLNIISLINFNQVAPGGANIYIRTSP
jgi:hypothetical protein